MKELEESLRERVILARKSLEAARADGDAYSADTFSAELADLLRRAAEHGIGLESGTPEEAGSPGAGTSAADNR